MRDFRRHALIYLLTDLKFVTYFPWVWAGTSGVISYFAGDFTWLSRAGAIIVLSGVLLSARRHVRNFLTDLEWLDTFREDMAAHGHTSTVSLDEPMRTNIEEDKKAAAIGPWMAFWGTLIWAYGDVVASGMRWWIHSLVG